MRCGLMTENKDISICLTSVEERSINYAITLFGIKWFYAALMQAGCAVISVTYATALNCTVYEYYIYIYIIYIYIAS